MGAGPRPNRPQRPPNFYSGSNTVSTSNTSNNSSSTPNTTNNSVNNIIINNNSNKKALLFGLNYQGTNARLNGCERDALNLASLLINKYGYDDHNVKVITYPDLTNSMGILYHIEQFFRSLKSNDHAFLSFSGHGTGSHDFSGDEVDGRDEFVIGYRLRRVSDDSIFNLLRLVPSNVKLLTLIDACHSGTILDLKWQYVSGGSVRSVSNRNAIAGPKIVMISGCRDDQVSMESGTSSGNIEGAMTRAFLDVIETDPVEYYTWLMIVDRMRSVLSSRGFRQVPQLNTNLETYLSTTFKI